MLKEGIWKSTSRFAMMAMAGVVVAGLVGCGDGSLGSVSGTIHLDGEPLEGAVISFYPIVTDAEAASMDRGRASHGRTDASGKYSLIYTRDKNGAEIGKHKIVITTLEEGGGGDYGGGQKERVPKKYNVDTTLEAEVTSGSNTIDFLDLDSEGEKQEARGERY
ncbi:MAG: carboxypeptidase regulatory-like domain-containing protein [Aureliella sp.]